MLTRLATAGALTALLLTGPARAQQSDPPTPDLTVPITNTTSVSLTPQTPGSLFAGIEEANQRTASVNVDYVSLRVAESLLNLSIPLEDPLPAIDLSTASGPGQRVDIDGSDAPAFIVTTADDVAQSFVLLHVRNGRADLVNLDMRSGLTDADDDPIALTVQVDANGTLGFRYDDDFTFDENITGAGGVVVDGPATLTLSGTNTYTGNTHVVTGTLVGNDVSLPGDFQLDEDTSLRFQIDDTTQTRSFAGNVSGAGRLVKSGFGTLFLSGGTATHSGGTEVESGTLQATPDSLQGDVNVASGSELWLVQNGATAFAGSITGGGSVRKSGLAPLLLSGANTFTGGLVVAGGDVRGTTASLPGSVTLEAVTARVIFDQATDGTHVGSISGTGELHKEGAGRVLRQGITSADLTRVAGGTLAGDTFALGNTIDVAAIGAVAEFAVDDVQSFGGSLSGPGDVSKTGAGSLILTNAALHSGRTTVSAGTLQLDAALSNTSLARVEGGGRLVNVAGSIGGSLESFGRVVVGGPTTTLSVGSSATFGAGSVLEVSLDDTGAASLLAVTGTASLDSPSWELDLVAGDYSLPVAYTVLSAGAIAPGSVAGQALDDLAFVNVVNPPTIVGSSVQLSVQEDFSGLGSLGTTPNQVSTANALEQVTGSGSPDARVIRNALAPLRTSQAPAVLDQLAGETLSAFTNPRIANAQAFADTISRRLRASSWELTRPPALAPADVRLPGVEAPPRSRGGPGAWLEPLGIFGAWEGRGNASNLDANAFGLSGGVDYRFSDRLPIPGSEYWRAGLAVGYTRQWVENDSGFFRGTADTVQTALWTGFRTPRFHAGAAVRFAWSGLQTDRHIAFTSLDRHAVADFAGTEWGGLVEIGGHFGHRRRARLHPFARFQYLQAGQDAITEIGAGDLSLQVPSLSFDSLLLTLGARVSRVFTLEGEFGIEPELRAAWSVDHGDRGRHVPAVFYATPGATPFVTAGTEPDRNAFTLGLGYVMMLGDVPLLSTHYDVEIGEYHTTHVLSAGILFRW